MPAQDPTVTIGLIVDRVAEANRLGNQTLEYNVDDLVEVYWYVHNLQVKNATLGAHYAAVADALSRVSKIAHEVKAETDGETVPSRVLTPDEVLTAITSNPIQAADDESVGGGL